MSQAAEKSNNVDISFIALGANLPSESDSPRGTLDRALGVLEEDGLRIVARSGWFGSPAWPAGSGPDYVNGAVAVTGEDDPAALLARLHRIEDALGRRRGAGRWDSRVCDLDLIAAGSRVMPDAQTWQKVADGAAEAARPGLVLPHPLMHMRAFVLVPLAVIAPDWRHPVTGKTVRQMHDALPAGDRATILPITG